MTMKLPLQLSERTEWWMLFAYQAAALSGTLIMLLNKQFMCLPIDKGPIDTFIYCSMAASPIGIVLATRQHHGISKITPITACLWMTASLSILVLPEGYFWSLIWFIAFFCMACIPISSLASLIATIHIGFKLLTMRSVTTLGCGQAAHTPTTEEATTDSGTKFVTGPQSNKHANSINHCTDSKLHRR